MEQSRAVSLQVDPPNLNDVTPEDVMSRLFSYSTEKHIVETEEQSRGKEWVVK